MDLVTAQVVTARGGNVTFHEEYTADGTYVQHLMLNAFADGDHKLPETVPVARIKTSTFLIGLLLLPAQRSNLTSCRRWDCLQNTVESQPAAASPADLQDPAKAPDGLSKAGAPRKRSRRKKPTAVEKETSGFAIEAPLTEPCLKRPRRKQKANVRLSDYVVGHVQATTDMQIPTTYKQARASKFWPQWRAAMLAELQPLKDHMTWRLVPRTDTKKTKVITCRWVFAVKKDERGRIKRFKARLVIHGFKQQLGINYTETYAPVIRFETIRAAIYYANQRGWLVLQYDVKTAFLYGDLDELIFMEQPPGFQIDGPSMVCRLLKCLYGLKQTPNIWNKTLHAKLLAMGLVRLDSDYRSKL
ncbi:hypothetical protein PR003_g27360 [Phytophthora rubi]|uniref:Reverse transcriptase Ty1/copia-type domain-containing protein n=2 Tax=Phytophthora TaxID=4783 RepID=A0A6A4BZ05_9STRA|nr:hypothetical protein PR003_g27360 [Phytophthora rubi]